MDMDPQLCATLSLLARLLFIAVGGVADVLDWGRFGEGCSEQVWLYTDKYILVLPKLRLSWKGGILAVMDPKHGAAEAQTPPPRNH